MSKIKNTPSGKFTEDLRTKVDFQRGTSIKDGIVSYPWNWGITIQNGHLFSHSDSFDTFEECLRDFNENGVKKLNQVQKNMKKIAMPERHQYDNRT